MLSRGEILAVDDDPDLLSLIAAALSREGFAVTCAASGEDCLARVQAGRFDAVILDLMMPGMGGTAALREIKKTAPVVEVMILTAHSSVDSAVECMRLGAFDYVRKPFDLDALASAVLRAVAKKRFAEISAAAFTAGSPEELASSAAEAAARLFGAEEVLVGLRQPDGGLKVSGNSWDGAALAQGPAGGVCAGALALLGEAAAGALQVDGEVVFPGAGGLGPVLAVALPGGEPGTGVLCAARRPGSPGFSEEELRRARVLGPLLGLALKSAQLNSELRLARGQLLRSQKMEALGLLVGQVAHDFNNLLSVIVGSAQLMQEDPSPANMSKMSGGILEIAAGASALIRQLLSFARRGEAQAAPADLNAVLGDSRLIIGKLGGKKAEVAFALAPDLPKVRVRAEQLKQAVFNLVVNARDAMPGGGRIRVATRLAGEELPPGLKAGSWAVVEVSDEGPGIPPENLARLFEPFFTTKPEGEGTGLGLHIAQEIAREYGGLLTAANRPGGGAVFSLYLPAASCP